jgi:phosphoribosylanthranilate isomerase
MDPTRVKFCGITRLEDAEAAVALGAWAIGLIFHEPSPRACDPAAGAEIAAAVRRRTEVAGVFVDVALDEIAAIADTVGLTLVQLHGSEGPAFAAEVARRTGCRVIKAARVHSGADIQALKPFHTDFHMLDTYVAGLPGGTGETFDWGLAASHRGRVPVILSGGLTPDNVAPAIAATRPFAVDVASGVESAPGVKDPELMAAFARAAAGAVAGAAA